MCLDCLLDYYRFEYVTVTDCCYSGKKGMIISIIIMLVYYY